MKISANLGFLWTDRSLPDAIRAAAGAGFDAVECHWPFATPAAETKAILAETGMPILGLNTRPGAGAMGLAALPGRGEDARTMVDEACVYAHAVGAGYVHVMAGRAEGPGADRAFRETLAHACDVAAAHQLTIVIEPMNPTDAPAYFLNDLEQAVEIVASFDRPELRLLFDCYHVAKMGHPVVETLRACFPIIAHIQIAGVPDRGRPDEGDQDYAEVAAELARLDWDRPVGAEYRPGGVTEDSLDWLPVFQAS